MSTNKTTDGMSKDEALRASYWGEVLRILEQSDVALKTAGLREDNILRIEHNEARTAVVALIAERDTAVADCERVRAMFDGATREYAICRKAYEEERDAKAKQIAALEAKNLALNGAMVILHESNDDPELWKRIDSLIARAEAKS